MLLEKYHLVLIEVKSSNDSHTKIKSVEIISDAKIIKNNKRSAQHQLRDHVEIIERILNGKKDGIQTYIMWPFLGAFTRDPKKITIKRWKEDGNLHVFQEVLFSQETFDRWFIDTVLFSETMNFTNFTITLSR